MNAWLMYGWAINRSSTMRFLTDRSENFTNKCTDSTTGGNSLKLSNQRRSNQNIDFINPVQSQISSSRSRRLSFRKIRLIPNHKSAPNLDTEDGRPSKKVHYACPILFSLHPAPIKSARQQLTVSISTSCSAVDRSTVRRYASFTPRRHSGSLVPGRSTDSS